MVRRYEFYVRVARDIALVTSNIKFISSHHRVMFFLLYKRTDNGVFDDFPKISEDSPKLSQRPDERSRTFSENFRRCPKISEDCRRLSRKTRRCFDDTPTNLSAILRDKPDVTEIIDIFTCEDIISSHVRISYLHMWGYHIFTCEDIVSFLSICYHSLYHWLLYLTNGKRHSVYYWVMVHAGGC